MAGRKEKERQRLSRRVGGKEHEAASACCRGGRNPSQLGTGQGGNRTVPRARWVGARSATGPRKARRVSARDPSAGPTSPRLLARRFAALRAAIPHRPPAKQAGSRATAGGEG